ncbi:MAG TPA: sigma 54-interacting transcriptional regulator [Vicinamibacterales bacterium]|jgi:DNA-binding NtrC family response regulator
MRPEDDLRLAASVDVPVLVTAGSRRERKMCARLIHDAGGYDRPFVTFSVEDPGSVIEKSNGSWRVFDREDIVLRRHFEEARGGTLFIDDIALLRAATQTQLHVLLEERIRHLASARPGGGRVRVVAGASRHLDPERATGAFCTSLFYRLNLIHIDLISHAGR